MKQSLSGCLLPFSKKHIIGAVEHVSDELLQQIVQRLVAALHPLEIHLFGSHATGKTHQHSDIDLLVVMPDDVGELRELTIFGYKALRHMGVPKDLVLIYQRDMDRLASVKFSLPYQVASEGKLLYAAPAASRATVV
jgi:predicted nucleotidyltransferase